MNRKLRLVQVASVLLFGMTFFVAMGRQASTLHITTGEPDKASSVYQPKRLIHRQHGDDISHSAYCVSNRVQQEIKHSASALFNNHKQCASWTESDFLNALMALCGRALPRNHNCKLPSTTREVCRDDRYIYYLDDTHRLNVLEQWPLYNYENFWRFIRCFSDYEQCIGLVHDFLQYDPNYQKYLSKHALQRIYTEYNSIKHRQEQKNQQPSGQQPQKNGNEQTQQQTERLVQETYDNHSQLVDDEQGEWHELCNVYTRYELGDRSHLEQRIDALRSINASGAQYTHSTYTIDNQASQLLKSHGYSDEKYKEFYGNQLQQVIHQECLTLLGKAASSPETHFVQRDVITDLVEAVHEYNQHGLVHKACNISDLCWSLFDYGAAMVKNTALGIQEIVGHPYEYSQAILEGGLQGLLMAADDVLKHPVQTVACAVAGGYVLAYQLSKVAYNLLDIGVTAVFDRSKAKEKWDDYIAPIAMVIDTISKKQMTLRDAVKNGTALMVCWRAQSKVFEGTNKFYCGIRDAAIEFAKKNPLALPERYLATPDGVILKAAHDMHFESLQKIPPQGTTPKSPQFSPEAIEASVKWALNFKGNGNKLKHIFGNSEHGFAPLLERIGGSEEVFLHALIQNLVENHILPYAVKFEIPVQFMGTTVTVRGFVHEGMIKLGTIFIPRELLK